MRYEFRGLIMLVNDYAQILTYVRFLSFQSFKSLYVSKFILIRLIRFVQTVFRVDYCSICLK